MVLIMYYHTTKLKTVLRWLKSWSLIFSWEKHLQMVSTNRSKSFLRSRVLIGRARLLIKNWAISCSPSVSMCVSATSTSSLPQTVGRPKPPNLQPKLIRGGSHIMAANCKTLKTNMDEKIWFHFNIINDIVLMAKSFFFVIPDNRNTWWFW